MTGLDELDKRLIYELRIDSRKSVRELAKSLAESPSTIYNRRKRLEDKNIITRFSVNLDFSQINLGKSVYFLVKVRWDDETSAHSVAEELKNKNFVYQISLISGRFDILLKVRLPSVDEVSNFVWNELRKIPGVEEIEQLQVFEEVLKEEDILDPFQHED
ncbi:MAG: Lrp/AsnC family transcriptional regulator [Methanobacteriota archaeon]|nr:MAG: Lrp/AsnC family transcriptional regulator [Euryarchaeota archaeon]